jgi:glycosyltransferase involved in cell wall biosynthesis
MDKNIIQSEIFLSIVIPVYNVEKYLTRCLDSILNQKVNFKFEIIVINDCSTDLSYSILMTYNLKYDNIILVNHKTNQKLSIARKSGIDLCKGDYIMHVDSDDWLEENSLQNIYNIVTNSLPDVVVFNYYVENSNQIRIPIHKIRNSHFVSERSEAQTFFLGAPWNKIVKRNLLNDIVFGSVGINNGEDLVYSSELFFKVEKIYLSTFSFYVYFSNLNSLTKVDNSLNFLKNQQLVLTELSIIIRKYQPTMSEINFIINYYLNFIYLEIFKYNFSVNKENPKTIFFILENISSNKIFSEKVKTSLNKAINSKMFSLLEVVKRFGIKKIIGIIIK